MEAQRRTVALVNRGGFVIGKGSRAAGNGYMYTFALELGKLVLELQGIVCAPLGDDRRPVLAEGPLELVRVDGQLGSRERRARASR